MAGKNGAAASLLNLTTDTITEHAVRVNSNGSNARLTYLMERLTTHLHDFARETRLSSDEWKNTMDFLVQCGQISSDVRHEFILLSDVLGLSSLVDSINHPKPPMCTEGSVLGPFHTHDAPHLPLGASMSEDPNGEPLLVICSIKDTAGNPIAGVKVDIWETDSTGNYDVQRADRGDPSERCVLRSDAQGKLWFKAVRPVCYPIPEDGPVGKLLDLLSRHGWRPAHIHFMFEKESFDHLITTLFIRGDPYVNSDAVFGAKGSLVVDLTKVDKELAAKYGVAEGTWLLQHDFVLASQQETDDLRDKNALEAMQKMGLKMKLVDHLPVPDVD